MNDNVLEIERLIPAPPERVFEYWTEPELVAKWFGPGDFDVPSSELDLRPGGKWRTTIRSPEGKLRTVSGVYNTIDPPTGWSSPGHGMTTTACAATRLR